jgi:hypothetical protein
VRHKDYLLIENSGFVADLFQDVRAWFLISNPIVKLLETSEIIVGILGELAAFCYKDLGTSSFKDEGFDGNVFGILKGDFSIG